MRRLNVVLRRSLSILLTAAVFLLASCNLSTSKLSAPRCDYERAPWQPCQPDGYQLKVLTLKSTSNGNNNSTVSRRCQASKSIKRDCKQGCKYQRGEWSAKCGPDGRRIRIDKLVAGSLAAGGHDGCRPQRQVIKDCRRACHYTRSAWSECNNMGLRTRNLTLVGLAEQSDGAAASGCQQSKQISRSCTTNSTTTAASSRASIASKSATRKPPSKQQKLSPQAPKAAVRQQQQMSKQLAKVGSTNTTTTTTSATTTTGAE